MDQLLFFFILRTLVNFRDLENRRGGGGVKPMVYGEYRLDSFIPI